MKRCRACNARIPNRAVACRRHFRQLTQALRRSLAAFTAGPPEALHLCLVEADEQLLDIRLEASP